MAKYSISGKYRNCQSFYSGEQLIGGKMMRDAGATPDKLQFAPGLPKTGSGKIMRRIFRKVA